MDTLKQNQYSFYMINYLSDNLKSQYITKFSLFKLKISIRHYLICMSMPQDHEDYVHALLIQKNTKNILCRIFHIIPIILPSNFWRCEKTKKICGRCALNNITKSKVVDLCVSVYSMLHNNANPHKFIKNC